MEKKVVIRHPRFWIIIRANKYFLRVYNELSAGSRPERSRHSSREDSHSSGGEVGAHTRIQSPRRGRLKELTARKEYLQGRRQSLKEHRDDLEVVHADKKRASQEEILNAAGRRVVSKRWWHCITVPKGQA